MSRAYVKVIASRYIDEYTWLGVTYDGLTGTLIVYIDGEVSCLATMTH